MGRKRRNVMPGLRQRNGIWHIEKSVDGKRLYGCTGTSNYDEAVRYLAHRLEQMRQATVYGVRPKRVFREAATKYIKENHHKRSLRSDATQLKLLDPFIGDLNLERINMGCLQSFIEQRREQGVKNRTINKALQTVRHIMKLAGDEWVDADNLTWVAHVPKIKLLVETDKSPPYPLSWEEQDQMFAQLPLYLRRMALFKVNTGLRDQEVCSLKWEWEMPLPELNTSIFVIPGIRMKNGLDRLVVLNEAAKQVVSEVRGEHPVYVFTCARWGRHIVDAADQNFAGICERNPIFQMNNNSWQKARVEVGLPQLRVHDLKHTFGCRLRAADVSYEDRQDLLGHKSSRITTHYSAADIRNLIDAANKVCRRSGNTPTLTIIRFPHNRAKPVGEANKPADSGNITAKGLAVNG